MDGPVVTGIVGGVLVGGAGVAGVEEAIEYGYEYEYDESLFLSTVTVSCFF